MKMSRRIRLTLLSATPTPAAFGRKIGNLRSSDAASVSSRRAWAIAVVGALSGLFVALPARATISIDDASIPVQEGPLGLNATDCNGDAIPDLIVANYGANSVTILRNRGDGTLVFSKTLGAPTVAAATATPSPTATATASGGSPVATPKPTKTPTPTGPSPTVTASPGVTSAVCGDFTGDGLPDVALVNRNSGTVTIRRRESTGDYTTLGSLPVGSLPNWVATADLNHDDKLDLVVVNSHSSDLTIMLGDGNGGFPLTSTLRLEADRQTNRPKSVALADFDGDGNLDILVASEGSPSLRLLLGDGAGTFVPSAAVLPSPAKLKAIATGDLDGDGLPDIAVLSDANPHRLNPAVMFFLNDGNGSFTPFGTFPVPPNTLSIALADFDGDGLVDLALSYFKTNDVQVLFASGPAQYAPPSRFGFASHDFASSVLFNPPNAGTTRTTSDGTQLVTFEKSTPALELIDLGTSTTSPLAILPDQPLAVTYADLTNDGIPDAVVVTKGKRGATLQVLPGNAAGGYDAAASGTATCGDGIVEGGELCDDGNKKNHDGCSATCAPEIGRKLTSINAADLNGDGNQDLVVTASNAALLLLGDGHGRFSEIRRLAKVRSNTPAIVADFDGDGVPDVLTVPFSSRTHGLALAVNDGTGQFTTVSLAPSLRLTGPMLAGDFDGDGLLDLVAGSTSSPAGAVILYNDGTGPNGDPISIPTGRGVTAFAMADFDEDGILDLLVSSSSATQPFTLFPGRSNGQYGSGETPFLGSKAAIPTVVDANQDLHEDVVLCDPSAQPACALQYGDGQGRFSAAVPSLDGFIGRDLRAVAAADFDGDGATDFVGVSRRDDQTVVLFGAGPTLPAVSETISTGDKPRAVAVDDLNGDGKPDIVVANGGSDDLSIFINQGDRQFLALPKVRLPKDPQGNYGDNPSAILFFDLNGDGKRDVVVSQEGSANIARFINLGGGGLASMVTLATDVDPVDVAVGDLNNDTIPDFVTANGSPGTVTVLLSNGSDYDTTIFKSGGLQPSGVALADLDGDGALDIVVINAQSNNVSTFLNDGNGVFTLKKVSQARGRHTPKDLCVADFDGDKVPDVAIASLGTKDVLVMHGKGDGTWDVDDRTYQVGGDVDAVLCTDTDGNGNTDIVFGRRSAGTIDVIQNGS